MTLCFDPARPPRRDDPCRSISMPSPRRYKQDEHGLTICGHRGVCEAGGPTSAESWRLPASSDPPITRSMDVVEWGVVRRRAVESPSAASALRTACSRPRHRRRGTSCSRWSRTPAARTRWKKPAAAGRGRRRASFRLGRYRGGAPALPRRACERHRDVRRPNAHTTTRWRSIAQRMPPIDAYHGGAERSQPRAGQAPCLSRGASDARRDRQAAACDCTAATSASSDCDSRWTAIAAEYEQKPQRLLRRHQRHRPGAWCSTLPVRRCWTPVDRLRELLPGRARRGDAGRAREPAATTGPPSTLAECALHQSLLGIGQARPSPTPTARRARCSPPKGDLDSSLFSARLPRDLGISCRHGGAGQGRADTRCRTGPATD